MTSGKQKIVYLKGNYISQDEAKISLFDRGYLFADGVYEVTAVVNAKLVDFKPHMKRLKNSLKELDIPEKFSEDYLYKMHHKLIEYNHLKEGIVYMQITRGEAERSFEYPENLTPVLSAFTQEKNLTTDPKYQIGIKVISIPDIRWKRRDIKSIALLAQAMGKQIAQKNHAQEAWMYENDRITEGTSSSAYIVRKGKIITRQISNEILAGITRQSLLKLARERQIQIEERPFSLNEAKNADEAFITSASNFIMPVISIDGNNIGEGKPGPITKRLREIYMQEIVNQQK